MRNLNKVQGRIVNDWVKERFGGVGDHTCGCFMVPSNIDGSHLRIIAASGGGWDHVSVSRHDRIPVWLEMQYIARMFFEPDEVCMELHVPPSSHVNCHPHCLHLWRPLDGVQIPLPPPEFVGPT